MRVDIETGAVDLVEAPENVLCGSVYIIASAVVREAGRKRNFGQLALESDDVAEEQYNTSTHEPMGIHHTVENSQIVHHLILG